MPSEHLPPQSNPEFGPVAQETVMSILYLLDEKVGHLESSSDDGRRGQSFQGWTPKGVKVWLHIVQFPISISIDNDIAHIHVSPVNPDILDVNPAANKIEEDKHFALYREQDEVILAQDNIRNIHVDPVWDEDLTEEAIFRRMVVDIRAAKKKEREVGLSAVTEQEAQDLFWAIQHSEKPSQPKKFSLLRAIFERNQYHDWPAFPRSVR